MEFNFFRKKEVAPQADVSVEPKGEAEKTGEIGKMTEEGERQAINEAAELEKVEVRDPKGKKNKAAIIAVLGLLTIFSATGCSRMDTRYITNQLQRDLLGDTLRNMDRKAEFESRDMLKIERNEASEIMRRKDMDVHRKKEAIHEAYQRRVKVN